MNNVLTGIGYYGLEITSMLAASTETIPNANSLSEMIKAISDFGVTLVIAAITLGYLTKFLNNMLQRDSSMINNIGPRLGKISGTLHDFQKSFNDAITAHNTHTNQVLASMQRDNKEMLETLQKTEELVSEMGNKLDVVEANYQIVCKLLSHYMKVSNEDIGEDTIAFIESMVDKK